MILLDNYFDQSRVRVIDYEQLDNDYLIIQLVEREIDDEHPDPNPYNCIVAKPKNKQYCVEEFGDYYETAEESSKEFDELVDKYSNN